MGPMRAHLRCRPSCTGAARRRQGALVAARHVRGDTGHTTAASRRRRQLQRVLRASPMAYRLPVRRVSAGTGHTPAESRRRTAERHRRGRHGRPRSGRWPMAAGRIPMATRRTARRVGPARGEALARGDYEPTTAALHACRHGHAARGAGRHLPRDCGRAVGGLARTHAADGRCGADRADAHATPTRRRPGARRGQGAVYRAA